MSRVLRTGRVAMAPVLGPDAAHTIVSISDDAGVALVTTSAAHGIGVSQQVMIAGTSVPGYNGGPFDATVISPTTFDISAPYTSDATGGSWSLV